MISDMFLAIDLDGTLLRSDGSLSLETIRYLNRWDGKIVFVTGRNIKDSQDIINQFDFIYTEYAYIIFDDGQYIGHIEKSNKSIRVFKKFECLNAAFISDFADWASRNHYGWVIYRDEETVSIVNRNVIQFSLIKLLSKGHKVRYRRAKINDVKGVNKISINSFNNTTIEDAFHLFRNRYSENYYSVINDNMIEIKDRSASKLKALSWLLQHLSVCDNECFYFGNGGNDIDCLMYFRHSYAVENSPDVVKAAAKKVILSNDKDGVIKQIRKLREVL